jgi:hypothetical protein
MAGALDDSSAFSSLPSAIRPPRILVFCPTSFYIRFSLIIRSILYGVLPFVFRVESMLDRALAVPTPLIKEKITCLV